MEEIPVVKVTSLISVPINDAYLRGISREDMEILESMSYLDSIEVMKDMTGKTKVLVIYPEPTKTKNGVEPSSRDMLNTPLDRRMGTNIPKSSCETCGMDFYYCGGHEGFIPLPFHYVQYSHRNSLVTILNSFCTDPDCVNYGKITITPFETDEFGDPIRVEDYSDMQLDYLSKFKERTVNSERSNMSQVMFAALSEMSARCGCSNDKKPWKLKDVEKNSVKQETKLAREGVYVDPRTIKRHLKVIDSLEYNREFFNIHNWMFSDLILSTIHVIALSKRPSEYDATTMKQTKNILTNSYNKILGLLEPVIRRKTNRFNQTEIMHTLYSAIHLSNDQKTSKRNVELMLRGPPESKSGLRYGMFSSRTNEASARAPLAGRDPEKYWNEELGEYRIRGAESVAVPFNIAKEMDLNVTVNTYNIDKVNAWLRAGLISKYKPVGGVQMDVTPITVRTVKMDIGYSVMVRMREGDESLYTRQPILSKMSVGQGSVYVIKENVMGIPLVTTQRYNADFDGDEMNLNKPGSRQAKAEMINYSVIEDVLPPSGTRASYGINYTNEYAIKEINKEDILPPDIFNEAWEITPSGYKASYFDRLRKLTDFEGSEKLIIEGATPNQVFSVLLPPKFNYNSGTVTIRDGIIVLGKIDTGNVTNSPTSIQAALYKEFNYVPAYIFINSIDYLLLTWMKDFGFTVGPSDLYPSDPVNLEKYKRGKEDLLRQVEKNLAKIKDYYDLTDDFLPVDKEDFNAFKQSLHSATKITGPSIELIEETFEEDNNALYRMSSEGISGSIASLNQMVMSIGVIGEMEYSDIDKHAYTSNLLTKVGFIKGSFTEGVSPETMYSITREGREKATIKQVMVHKGGTFNYQMTSVLSPYFITDQGFIMSIHGNVVDDVYGTQGIDDKKVSLVENGNEVVYDLIDNRLLADVITLGNEPPDVPDYLDYIDKYIGGLLYYYGGIIVYGSPMKQMIEDIRHLGEIYNAEIIETYVGSVNDEGDFIETKEDSSIEAYNMMIFMAERGTNYKLYDVTEIELFGM